MNINFANIPSELKALRQWVNWEFRQGKKVPLDPKNGRLASVTDPSTWAGFMIATDSAQTIPDIGIGFVLTADDPYAFIDLDDPEGNPKIIETYIGLCRIFDSYTEWSPSGVGAHIIVRGAVQDGRKFGKIEVYSSRRYMTITGNTMAGTNPVIEDRHDHINELIVKLDYEARRIASGSDHTISRPQTKSDDKVMSTAWTAKNGSGERFQTLWRGEWNKYFTEKYGHPNHHKSPSEGDFALINMLVCYTRNRVQMRRLFNCSALGQRKKARRDDYIEPMITKAIEDWERRQPRIDYEENRRLWLEHVRDSKKSGG